MDSERLAGSVEDFPHNFLPRSVSSDPRYRSKVLAVLRLVPTLPPIPSGMYPWLSVVTRPAFLSARVLRNPSLLLDARAVALWPQLDFHLYDKLSLSGLTHQGLGEVTLGYVASKNWFWASSPSAPNGNSYLWFSIRRPSAFN